MQRQIKTYKMVEDFIADNLHHLERLHRRNRVDEHVAMNTNKVLRIQDAVFILCL